MDLAPARSRSHLVECWDRDVARSRSSRYVLRPVMATGTEVTVVPGAARLRPRDPDACSTTARAGGSRTRPGRYEHVDVAVVPYFFGMDGSATWSSPASADAVAATPD